MNRIKIIFLGLIILTGLVRLFILLNSDNFAGSIPMGRVAAALSILKDPSLHSNFDGNTSVLYHYLLAVTLQFWPDPLLAPRLLSLIFGILLIIPFYLLVKMLFSERTALYSSILLSLYPLHTIQSSISTSDVIFHFFFFSCLYYFFKFKQKERRIRWLILSVVLFNIAAMLRFESWSFISLLPILLYKDGKRYAKTFFLLSLILPLLWLYLCYHYTGNAFYSLTSAARTSHAEILLGRAPHSKEIFGWLKILYKTAGTIVVTSAIFGIIYSSIKKRYLYFALFFLYLYSLYTANTILARMWYHERYSILLGLLILPYSVLCIEKISTLLRLKPAILLLPFIFFSAFESKRIVSSYIPQLPAGIKEVASWLKLNALPSDKLIISSDEWDVTDQDIIVRSGIHPRNFFVVSTPLAFPYSIAKESIKEYITNIKPHYLILNSTSYLQKILNFDMGQKDLGEFGYTFESVFSKDTSLGKFNIYKIYYKYN